jgi:hypothetical protein
MTTTIETMPELDALGPKSVILDRDGYGWQKDIRLEGYWWGIARDTLASTRKLVDFGPFEVLRNVQKPLEAKDTK